MNLNIGSLTKQKIATLAAFVSLAAVGTGCPTSVPIDVEPSPPTNPDNGPVPGNPDPAPTPSNTPAPQPSATPTPPPASGDFASCRSADPEFQCMALKLVTYQDAKGVPTVNRVQAVTLVEAMNKIWASCKIGFEVEQYVPVDPTVRGLSYDNSEAQLSSIRREFQDKSSLLVGLVGPWYGKTIAWTSMPGSSLLGTIVEQQYSNNPFTVGHELGHYMGLYHIKNSSNLMNPYIGTNTSGLYDSQCNTARSTNMEYWTAMMR